MKRLKQERTRANTEIRDSLSFYVEKLRDTVTDKRKKNLNDNKNAHNIWMNLSKDMAIKRMKKTLEKEGAPLTKPFRSEEKVRKKIKKKKSVNTTKQEHKQERSGKKIITHKPKSKMKAKRTAKKRRK